MKLAEYNVAEEVTSVAIAAAVELDASDFQDERVALIFTVGTVDASAVLTIEAGSFSEGSQGAIEVPVDAAGVFAVCIETARFKDADGKVNIAVDTMGALVGTIAVLQLP